VTDSGQGERLEHHDLVHAVEELGPERRAQFPHHLPPGLLRPEIERIVDLQIADVRARLADQRITLELTEPARELIAE
jgi:C-terminal, D2-small domain, of ClpB protein